MKPEQPKTPKTTKKRKNKGMAFAGGLCRVLGTLILLAVVAVYLPLTVPQMLGYQIYEVVSGSMDPAIPVDSVVYVQAADAAALQAGEIVAFGSENAQPVIHRVVENRVVEGELVTKGDANAQNDMNPVAYARLIGRVAFHLPVLGRFAAAVATTMGKVYAIGFLVAAALLQLLGGRFAELSES